MSHPKKHAVLVIGHSRPDHMSRVLSKIAIHFPDKLYIFIDGVAENSTQRLIESHDKVVTLANNCNSAKNVKVNISKTNLGCGISCSNAIDWALSTENEIIILEDDVLPGPDFFNYMDKNLIELNQSDCMMISSNKFDRFPQFKNSIKTKFTFMSGWATWKRAWNKYDYRLTNFDIDRLLDKNLTFLCNKLNWIKIANEIKSDKDLSYWDYQWQFIIWENNGWSLQPPRPLTKNIGFDTVGTHTGGLEHGDWRELITYEGNNELIRPGFKKIGRLHNLIISIYTTSIPGYIHRKFKFKI